MTERIAPRTPQLAKREALAIEDLTALYPDKVVIGVDSKDKPLGKRLSKLYVSLGYESRKDMIRAWGFSYDATPGGVSPTLNYEAVLSEIARRYEDKPKPKTVKQMQEDNPDLSANFKTLNTNARKYFGRTFAKELKARGLLSEERGKFGQEDVDAVIAELDRRYKEEAGPKPKTVKQLLALNPDMASEIQRAQIYVNKTSGSSLKKLLIKHGVLASAAEQALLSSEEREAVLSGPESEAEVEAGLVPEDERPSSFKEPMESHPQHAAVLKQGQKDKSIAKDTNNLAVLLPEELEAALNDLAILLARIPEDDKPATIKDLAQGYPFLEAYPQHATLLKKALSQKVLGKSDLVERGILRRPKKARKTLDDSQETQGRMNGDDQAKPFYEQYKKKITQTIQSKGIEVEVSYDASDAISQIASYVQEKTHLARRDALRSQTDYVYKDEWSYSHGVDATLGVREELLADLDESSRILTDFIKVLCLLTDRELLQQMVGDSPRKKDGHLWAGRSVADVRMDGVFIDAGYYRVSAKTKKGDCLEISLKRENPAYLPPFPSPDYALAGAEASKTYIDSAAAYLKGHEDIVESMGL